MSDRRITFPDLDSSHEVGSTASNGVQVYAKGGKLYAQREGETAIELANLTSGETAVPTGTIITFAASSVPNGWLECDGTELDATYSALNTVLDGIYGTGGSGRSLLPNLKGRMAIGAGDGGTGVGNRALAATGGVNEVALTSLIGQHSHGVSNDSHSHSFTGSSHSHQVDSHYHSTSSHTHGGVISYSFNTGTFDSSGHTSALTSASQSTSNSTDSGGGDNTGSTSPGTTSTTAGGTVNSGGTGITIDNEGGTGNHDNMSPFLVLKYLIRT